MAQNVIAHRHTTREDATQPLLIRLIAKGISVVFHPLFIPIYLLAFVLYVSDTVVTLNPEGKFRLLLSFCIMYLLFPVVTVLLAKGLGFLDSIYLRSQKDRIIPYVACGVYYFWMWYVLRNQTAPPVLVVLTLAIFLSSSAGLLLNSFLKVSMHALAMGVATAFLLMLALVSGVSFGRYLSLGIFIAGLVCTSRLINLDHSPKEVYVGLLIGSLAVAISFWFEG